MKNRKDKFALIRNLLQKFIFINIKLQAFMQVINQCFSASDFVNWKNICTKPEKIKQRKII